MVVAVAQMVVQGAAEIVVVAAKKVVVAAEMVMAAEMVVRGSQYAEFLTIVSYMQSYMFLLISFFMMPIFLCLNGKSFSIKCARISILNFFYFSTLLIIKFCDCMHHLICILKKVVLISL